MGNPGLSTDPLSYLEYVKIAREIQFYHGGNEQAKMQGFVFVFVFDWKLGLGLCCNLLCHSTVRVCQRFKWQTFFLSHAILYFENIEECNVVIVSS